MTKTIYNYIIVKDGENKTYQYRKSLYHYGLRFNKKGKYVGSWKMKTDDMNQVEKIKSFCHNHRLYFRTFPETLKRSSTYRDVFYNNNPPVFGNYYVCAYCFFPYKKKNITVDHIIPVGQVHTNFCRYLLQILNIENINESKNLAAACKRCNSRKNKKIGLWTLRGFLGKKKWFIISAWIAILCFFILSMFIALQILYRVL